MKPIPQSIEPRLPVEDLTASLLFYRDLLGLDDNDTVFEQNGFAILRTNKIGIQLISQSDAHPGQKNTIWIDCTNVVSIHESVKGRFNVEWGPEIYHYGRLEFAIIDPDGHRIIFSEPSIQPVSCPEQ